MKERNWLIELAWVLVVVGGVVFFLMAMIGGMIQ